MRRLASLPGVVSPLRCIDVRPGPCRTEQMHAGRGNMSVHVGHRDIITLTRSPLALEIWRIIRKCLIGAKMLYLKTLRALILMASAALIPLSLQAQSTGTVASPVIKPGAFIGLSAAMAVEDGEESFAYRLGYRNAVRDNLRLSAMAFIQDRTGSYRYRRLAVEAMRPLVTHTHDWHSALQIRGYIPDGQDGPARLRVAWLNRWRPVYGGELRLIGLASHEFGRDSRPGLFLETRGEATWRLGRDTRLGIQLFNRYNSTAKFGAFDTQRHSAGAVIKGALSPYIRYRVNALTGLSSQARDIELRFRVGLTL